MAASPAILPEAAEAEAERRLATTRTGGSSTGALLQMFRDLDTADSISSILGAIERVAGSVSSKVSLYVGPASAPVRWPADGSPLGLDSPVAAVLRTGSDEFEGAPLGLPLLSLEDALGNGPIRIGCFEDDGRSMVTAG